MADYKGSNTLDDVMGSGTGTAGTSGIDRWSSGGGNDTFVYELASMNGADRFSGGTGSDTVEFRLTSAEWNGGVGPTATAIIALKNAVDARVTLSPGGVTPSGSGYAPLTFGIGKTLTVLEAENVRVYADGVLVLGTAPASTVGFVKEAGVDLSYAPLPGTPVATGVMPSTDLNGNPIPVGSTWTVGAVNVGAGLSPDIYSKLGTSSTGFSIDKTSGAWTYTLDNTDTDTQDLQNGQAIKMSFQAIATAPDGKSATFQNVVITLNGTNDIQTVVVSSPDTTVDERGGVNNGSVSLAEGGDGASGTLALTNVDNTPIVVPVDSFQGAGSVTMKGVYGDLVVTRIFDGLNNGPTGQAPGTGTNELTQATWSYTLRNNDGNVQALTGSDIKLDPIALTASKFDGASNVITITISGSDDAAVLAGGEQDLQVIESGGIQDANPGDKSAGGTFTQSDVDSVGPFTFAPLNNNPVVLGVRDATSTEGVYGTFTLNPTTGEWTYTLDNTRAVTQALNELWTGKNVQDGPVEFLTVSSSVNLGATKTIAVKVLGRDDLTQDILNAYDATAGATVDEAFAGDNKAGGKLSLVDIDLVHADFSAAGLNFGGPAAPVPGLPIVVLGGTVVSPTQSTYKGSYGDFSLDPTTGVWTYVRNDGVGYLNSEELKSGQFGTDVMQVRSNDFGAFENVVVTVIGMNDAPTVTGPVLGNVVEAGGPLTNTVPGTPTATGKLVVADQDAGESGWSTPSGTVTAGTYGTFTFTAAGDEGTWLYQLDNSKLATEQLTAGQTVTDKLTLTTTDGTTGVVTVTITGANDHATIAVVGTPDVSVKEFGGVANTEFTDNPSASGFLKVTDIDGKGALNESRFRAPTADSANPAIETDLRGKYGDFTFNPGTGAWTYELNNSIDSLAELVDPIAVAQVAALQGLADLTMVTDRLVVRSEDFSATAIITVNVEGTYDVAAITNTPGGNGSSVQAEGTVRTVPADPTTAVAVTPDYFANGNLNPVAPSKVDTYNPAGSLVGTYGVFQFNTANGAWSYVLDNEDPDTLALISGETKQDFLTVSTVAGVGAPSEVYTIVVDVAGAHTVVDLKGVPVTDPGVQLQSPNVTPADLVTGAAPVINGAGGVGSITFIARNGETGGDSALSLHAGDPLLNLPSGSPWGTVTVNDGTLTTVTMPLLPATQLAPPLNGTINEVLHVWDGDTQTATPAALSLGVSIAQGTVARDTIVMIGNYGDFGGMASGYDEIDNIFGTPFRDFIDGGSGDDILTGDPDQTNAVGGNDTIVGGAGRDDIVGNFGDDVLWGGTGDDTIAGDTGNDTLIGGTGRDLMQGGQGDNMFYFGTGPFGQPNEDDTIVDFSTSTDGFSNTDKLWFAESLLLTNGYNNNVVPDAFSIVNNQWFATASAADILAENYGLNKRFIFDNVNGLLYFDVDGGGAATSDPLLVAYLENTSLAVTTLTPADFLFTPTGP